MNRITEIQNAAHNLRRLAAQRDLYSDAKRLQALLIIVSTGGVVVWSILALVFPGLKQYAALWACSATLLDVLCLTPLIRDKKTKAARIQEEFDCEVLDLPWCQCKAGDKPEPELLSCQRRVEESDPRFAEARDWYPKAVQTIPLDLARLLCQRSCCWWDRTIRQRCQQWSVALIVAAMLLIVVLGMASGASVQNAVSVVLLIQPSLIFLVRFHKEHHDAAQNAERLRKIAEGLWRRAVAGSMDAAEACAESRLLQNEIFDHRSRSPLVFDWLYRWLRHGQEASMQDGATELIEQYFRERPQTFHSGGGTGE